MRSRTKQTCVSLLFLAAFAASLLTATTAVGQTGDPGVDNPPAYSPGAYNPGASPGQPSDPSAVKADPGAYPGDPPRVPGSLWPLTNQTVRQVWSFNTVKQKMLKRETILATRLTSNTATSGAPGSNLANYCTVASTPGNDFVWTDMVHSGLEFSYTWKMWATLPTCTTAVAHLVGAEIFYAKRVNFVTKAYYRAPDPGADLLAIKEMSRTTDGGAMVIMIEAENGAQAQQIVERAYYPPVGQRDLGPGQYNLVYPTVTNYVGTYNANVTVLVNISTILGVSNAWDIAGTPGIHGVFLDTANLESESGYAIGSKDFTMLQDYVVNAFRSAGKYVCMPTWNTTATSQTTADTLTCSP